MVERNWTVCRFRAEELSGFEIDGVLGIYVLRGSIVRFDFDHHRMDILEPPIRDRSAWGARIPFAYDEAGQLRILATIGDGKTVPLLVDTGMHGTSGVSFALSELNANDPRPK